MLPCEQVEKETQNDLPKTFADQIERKAAAMQEYVVCYLFGV